MCRGYDVISEEYRAGRQAPCVSHKIVQRLGDHVDTAGLTVHIRLTSVWQSGSGLKLKEALRFQVRP